MNFRFGTFSRSHKIIFLTLLLFIVFTVAYAVPPTTKYQPAETLDPNCIPGTLNCTVTIFPDQTTHAGEYLTTNGTDVSWAAVSGGATNLSYTAATRVLASDTGTDATLPLFTSTDPGLVPLSGGGTTNFLRADGSWAAAGGTTETASNGLTKTGNDIQLGGTLTGATTITGGANTLAMSFDGITSNAGLSLTSNSTAAASQTQRLFYAALSGANATGQDTYAAYIQNTHTDATGFNYGVYSSVGGGDANIAVKGLADGANDMGVYGKSNSGMGVYGLTATGNGIKGEATSGIGVYGIANTGIGVSAQSQLSGPGLDAGGYDALAGRFISGSTATNTVMPVIEISRAAYAPTSNGFGGSIDFKSTTSTGSTYQLSNQIISEWTDATDASRTSEFSITGVNNAVTADLFTISGSGATKLNKYGVGTFTGTPAYTLQVDSSGNIIEGALVGGGGATASNGLSIEGGSGDVILGGTLLNDTVIENTSGYNLNINVQSITDYYKGALNIDAEASTTALFLNTHVAVSGAASINLEPLVLHSYWLGTPNVGENVRNLLGQSIVFVSLTTDNGDYAGGTVGSSSVHSSYFHKIESRVTNANFATRTGELTISAANNGTFRPTLKISGTGQLVLPTYATDSYTGTAAFDLAIDSSGNVITVATGGGGSGTVTSVATSNGITGGTITGTGTISGVDALADGSTKGVASYTANDFNASSGNISIDYTNGQVANGSTKGLLTSADWTTFNNKQPQLNGTGFVKASGTSISYDNTTYQSALSLTTTGSSGAATLIGSTLNIPQYSGGGGTNIYNSNGTLTSDRVVEINNLSLVIEDIGSSTQFGMYPSYIQMSASGADFIAIDGSGGGIGINSPNGIVITSNGNLTVVGSGTTCVIGSGTSATMCSSDERLKTNITPLGDSLELIRALRPVTFTWADPHKPQGTNIGFIAQEVQSVFPQFVGEINKDGTLGLDYAALITPTIKAIQELDLKISGIADLEKPNTFRESLITWFGNITNGIEKLFAKEVHTEKICVKKSDDTEVCVTGDELQQIMEGQSTTTITIPPPPVPPTTDPVPEKPVNPTEPPSDGGTPPPPAEPTGSTEQEISEPQPPPVDVTPPTSLDIPN